MKNRLKRKISLRDSYRRKVAGMPLAARRKAYNRQLRRSPLRRISKGLKASTVVYRCLEALFLSRPENKWCEICTRRREAGENICRNQSTEVHHYAGRIGRLLCYTPYFIASCFFCREWPHQHKRMARDLQLLARAPQWNVYPV
jgi:predicted amidophosphoribosyltransferase